jgi:DNA-binding NarL/FixJ family response regulator
MIRVVLADDQALVRAGFRALLDAQDDIEVIGEAGDGEEAVGLAAELQPDIVLMDIRMPGMDGLEATRRIVQDEQLDRTRIVILTTFDVDEYVFETLRMGASGFLVKDTEPEVLLQGVRAVARGDALLSPGVTRRLIGAFAGGQGPAFPSGSTTDRILATVMFSDIVSSTERAAEIGDRRWRGVLDRHDELVRRQINDHGGREIKTTGDGFLALFDAPARAIRCAISIREALRGRRRPDRASLRRGGAACERRRRDRCQHRRSSGGVRLCRRRGGLEHGEGSRGRIGHRVRRPGAACPQGRPGRVAAVRRRRARSVMRIE